MIFQPKKMSTTINLVQMTNLSCNFRQLSLTQSRDMAKIWACQVIRHIVGIVKGWGILSKISSNYALNICLITFARKLHQICKHRYYNFKAIIVIHLHWNNMGFNKNHPFMASPGTKMSHIIKKVPLQLTLSFSQRSVQTARRSEHFT